MNKTFIFLNIFCIFTLSFFVNSEDILDDYYMNNDEYKEFKIKVSQAVTSHPEYLAATESLKASSEGIRASKSNLLPQIQFVIDSDNVLDRSFETGPDNLFEKSKSDHKTNASLTISQLLYDFGATKNDISKSEALFKASRADLSIAILNLTFQSITSFINVASYSAYEKVVESSYKRHKNIKERIAKKVEGGMSASRELSRAMAREAEAYAKLTSARQNLSRAISAFRIYFPDEALPLKIPFYNISLLNRNFIEARNLMLVSNPEILKANENLRASMFNSELVNSGTLPRLDLKIRGSQYNLTDQSDEYDLYSGINLSYDIYSGGKNRALKNKASSEVLTYQNNRDSLLRNLSAELNNSLKNIKLIPESLSAYRNAYKANKQSRFYANEQFETSNALLLDLLQTERDFLESSEAMLESMRSSQIENYIFLKLTGELGEEFKIILN
mgnify:CR=1 FL=1